MSATTPAIPVRRLPAVRLGRFMRTGGIVIAFVLLVAVVTAFSPTFLSSTNVTNMLGQWAPAGIMAVGMTFVILTGGFDLSVASGYSLCAVTAAGVGRESSPEIAFAAAVGVGLGIGLANGLLVAGIGINPFIATVGTGFVLNGLSLVITGNAPFVVDNPDFGALGTGAVLGVPYLGLILIGALIVGGLVLALTSYGRQIYAVGGNAEASRLSGIPVRSVVGSTYVISGVCMGVAGVLSASQLSSAQPNLNPAILFDVITIVVIGGTSLTGGFGSMWRTAVGIGIIATIGNGMNLLDISPYYQDIIKGSIIVGALTLDVWAQKAAARATFTEARSP